MKKIRYTKEACPHCGNYTNRGPTVDAIIVRDGNILLGKRGAEPDKGKWALCGGYVDWDETIADTVRREVKEETNLETINLKFMKFYDDPHRHPQQNVAFTYIVDTAGEPQAGDDLTEVQWFALDSLPSPLAFDHEKQIQDYIRMSVT